jgi:hypothetical protein
VRVYLTGASGFVGSNLAAVFERHGAEVIRPGRRPSSSSRSAPSAGRSRGSPACRVCTARGPAGAGFRGARTRGSGTSSRRWWTRGCGGEHADRQGLARRAVAVFGLDEDLLDVGPPDPAALPAGGVPFDTRLDATATAAALDADLPDLDTMLARLRAELETCWSAA